LDKQNFVSKTIFGETEKERKKERKKRGKKKTKSSTMGYVCLNKIYVYVESFSS